MGAKGHSQSKFMRIVTIPVKVLGKARDFYVKSMIGCATRASSDHTMCLTNSQLPKSYSMGSSMSSDNDDFRDLIRAASVRSLGHKNEIDMLLHQMKQQSVSSKQLPKSSSDGMGFMGRIDEENPSDEEGSSHGGSKKSTKPELYPRSRSYAVAKTSVAL